MDSGIEINSWKIAIWEVLISIILFTLIMNTYQLINYQIIIITLIVHSSVKKLNYVVHCLILDYIFLLSWCYQRGFMLLEGGFVIGFLLIT